MEILLSIACLLCLIFIMGAIFRKADMIKLTVLAASVFFCCYCIVSGLLFYVDAFSFFRVLGILLVIFFAVLGILFLRNGYRFNLSKRIPTYRDFAVACFFAVLCLLLSANKSELYNAGQDQGLYQAEAIELYMGNYEVQYDFEEYSILENEEEKEAYFEMLDDAILGFYPLTSTQRPPYGNVEALSDVSGMYHGVQTFPALLALGGKLFGLENMMQIQTVFFYLAVMLLLYTAYNLNFSWKLSISMTLLFALSPLLVWISQNSYTEVILTLCFVFYLFMLSESDTPIKRILMTLPLLAFTFIHISFLFLYPVFILVYTILFLQSGKNEYLLDNVIVSAGMSLGYTIMSKIAPVYFKLNCGSLFDGTIVTEYNFMYWIYGGCVLVSISSFFLGSKRGGVCVYNRLLSIRKFYSFVVICLLSLILYHGIKMGWLCTPDMSSRSELVQYWGTGIKAFAHLTLYAFAMATGFVLVPFVIVMIIRKQKLITEKPLYFILYILFVYCVLVYSVVLRKEIQYYYYYSRYLAMYLPLIFLLTGVFFRTIKSGWKYLLLGAACCSMLLFDISLMTQKDQTALTWKNLTDISETLEEDSAVILGSESVQSLLGLPLRTLSGCAIFPVFDDVESEIALLTENYSHVYFLDMSDNTLEELADVEDFAIVYRDTYTSSDASWDSSRTIYPLQFDTTERELILYEYSVVSAIDPANGGEKKSGLMTGYYEFEDSFVWVREESVATLTDSGIAENGLELEITIPEEIADAAKNEEIEIYVNGELSWSLPIEEGHLTIQIPSSSLPVSTDGKYEVMIKCPVSFVPADDGVSSDTRELALQIWYLGRIRD